MQAMAAQAYAAAVLALAVLLLALPQLAAAAAAAGSGGPAAAAANVTDAERLLGWKSTFENGGTVLASWQPGTDPCSADWMGVQCAGARVRNM